MMVQSFPGSPTAASSDPMFWNKGPAPGLTFLLEQLWKHDRVEASTWVHGKLVAFYLNVALFSQTAICCWFFFYMI